jgi:uncharacterized membrane protein
VAVALRQLEVIAKVAEQIRGAEASAVLLEHAKMIYDANMAVVQEPRDRADLEDRFQQVISVVSRNAPETGQHPS